MAYLATELITRAYNLAAIVARDSEAVSGSQLNDGLSLLNDVLALKNANNRLIPFFTTYNLTAVIGQESYFIPNLIYADSVTFNLNTVVRIPLRIESRKEYFGSVRVNDIVSSPFKCNINRAKGGANFCIYPLPNDEYPIAINGKFGLLSDITYTTDLSLIYDRLYIAYLRYALAEYLCTEYGISLPPQASQKLDVLEQSVRDLAPIDITNVKSSTLRSYNRMGGWSYVNLSGGFTPS
jgi:hypothetical protein